MFNWRLGADGALARDIVLRLPIADALYTAGSSLEPRAWRGSSRKRPTPVAAPRLAGVRT